MTYMTIEERMNERTNVAASVEIPKKKKRRKILTSSYENKSMKMQK